ncbi:hypothetical protein [Leptospira kmetyi]|uniref:Lipoprotein n=1 Tax=Leptospira kmetyi TaxID=408139 RepID=A0ABX4N739_9LEPT|nr:hypothetical protein [Leptospira kmetyi]PJZ28403.1 hypothetical protein CH378_18190 [Leptospira kmetyi]
MSWKILLLLSIFLIHCQKINQIPVVAANPIGSKDNKVVFHFLDFSDRSVLIQLDLNRLSQKNSSETILERTFIQEMNIRSLEKEVVLESGSYSGKITLSYRTKRPIIFNYSARTVLRFLNASVKSDAVKKNECKIYDYDSSEDKEIVYICSTLDLTQEDHTFKFKNKESKRFDTMSTSFIWGIAVLGLFNTPSFYGFFAPILAGVAHFKNEIELLE